MCFGLVAFGGILCDALMVGFDGNNASIIVCSDVGWTGKLVDVLLLLRSSKRRRGWFGWGWTAARWTCYAMV